MLWKETKIRSFTKLPERSKLRGFALKTLPQQIFLRTFSKNFPKQRFSRKPFNSLLVVGNGFVWHTHLAHPHKRNSYPIIFYTYPKTPNFSNNKTNFWNCRNKTIYQTKYFLYFRKKIKELHFRCVLNTLCYFLC